MKRVLVATTVALVACSSSPNTPIGPSSVAPDLRVATYNLYLGADVGRLLSSMPDPATVPMIVSQLFDAVKATDPPVRMDAVAALLAVEAPDVIALQEASLWRTQANGDGSATPATEVAFDFVQLLLDGLSRRGLSYGVAVTQDNADVEATDASGGDVRMTDRDVILVRSGVATASPGAGHFDTNLKVSTPLGMVNVARGWVSTHITARGQTVLLMNTHLEAASETIRDAQAAELLTDTADDTQVLLVGDFNFAPGSLPYQTFDLAELDDSGDAGPTCCQDVDLRNPQSKLSERIDLLFERGAPSPLAVRRLGADSSALTASGVWPSDHAGVVVDYAVQ